MPGGAIGLQGESVDQPHDAPGRGPGAAGAAADTDDAARKAD